MKYYFGENDEHCFPLDYFNPGKVVYEAAIVRNSDMLFCNNENIFEMIEKGGCGKCCKFYSPRNKKSGICNYNGPVYEKSDKKIIV